MSDTNAASPAFFHGTIHFFIPLSFASATIGKIPFTGCTFPFSPPSPATKYSLTISCLIYPNAVRTATATGRSNPEPDFLIFAGVKLIVICFGGRAKPQFFNAVRTLSLASCTSEARNPTISNTGRPSLTSASTEIGTLWIPCMIAVDTILYNVLLLFIHFSSDLSDDHSRNAATDLHQHMPAGASDN